MTKEIKPKKVYNKKPNGKNATGRPSDYKEEYCDDIVDYFLQKKEEISDIEWEEEDVKKKVSKIFPSFIRYAISIGVDEDTLINREKSHKNFFGAREKCRKIQEAILVENWLMWLFHPWFTQFILKNNHWYKDKTEVDTNVKMEVNDITPKQQSAIDSLKKMFISK